MSVLNIGRGYSCCALLNKDRRGSVSSLVSPWTGETCLCYHISIFVREIFFHRIPTSPFLLFSRTKVVSPYYPSVLLLQMTRRNSSPIFYGLNSAENQPAPLPQQVFQGCLIYAVQQASSNTFENLHEQARETKSFWCTCQLSRYEIDSVLAKGVAIRDRTRFQLLGSETLVCPPKSKIHQATDD